MTVHEITVPNQATAQLVLTRFKEAFLVPLRDIDVEGNWQDPEAEQEAAQIAEAMGLPEEQVREIIQLYRINDAEWRLHLRVKHLREALLKPELADADLRPIIEEVAAEAGVPTGWLWGRFPLGGLARTI